MDGFQRTIPSKVIPFYFRLRVNSTGAGLAGLLSVVCCHRHKGRPEAWVVHESKMSGDDSKEEVYSQSVPSYADALASYWASLLKRIRAFSLTIRCNRVKIAWDRADTGLTTLDLMDRWKWIWCWARHDPSWGKRSPLFGEGTYSQNVGNKLRNS